MPLEKSHVARLQSERQAKKVTKVKYPPGTVTLQVLGSGVRGAPKSLYMFTDQSCYLFNCGEGSQRLAHEHRFKLSKVEHIFFTHTSWGNVGGLPGISLTIQDVGVPNITLHGAPGLGDLFVAASRFIILKDLQVNHIDATNPESTFEDAVMKMNYIPIMPDETGKLPRSATNSPIEEEDVTNYYSREKGNPEDVPAAKRTRVEKNGDMNPSSKAALAYICRLHPKQGMLMAEKCVEFGVPPGPLYGQLKAGQDITLPNGKTVLASDVRSPDDPGPVFVVVECPDESYLDNFVSEPQLRKLQRRNGATELDCPKVVVHFTPIELTRHPKYQEWMDGFDADACHMMLGFTKDGEERRGFGSLAVHRIQHQLHLLDSEIFPHLPFDLRVDGEPEHSEASELDCQTLTTYYLRPLKKLDLSLIPILKPQEYVDESLSQEGFKPSLDALKLTLADAVPISNKTYPKLVFLGTGSCIPNKTRNTSAILVELEKDRFILMDCGEGTYGQIVRFFGHERAAQVLSNLVGVYISHLHADHHIGLIGLLQGRQHSIERTKSDAGPLMLIAPHQINFWLKTYHYSFERIRQYYTLVACANLLEGKTPDPALITGLNLKSIVTTHVRHCPNAFGVSLTTADGFKLTYSGDTMPCLSLIDIGRDSDLLIHESTMEDGMEVEAQKKTHCTTSQAIEVGRSMGAKFTLLTHFSQRYSKIPIFNEKSFASNTIGVAFDNMQISPDRLHHLPYFIPSLKLMFADHCEEMDNKTNKRKLRQEREEKHKQLQRSAQHLGN